MIRTLKDRTLLCATLLMTFSGAAHAQTGVSDDRVSLPEGPGSLEGIGENVEVDPNMGLMRHSVPIRVPQGFAGVTPQLALSYSSGGGSSVVGMGWSIDMPSIERMTYRGLPVYDSTDDFCVGGSDQLVRLPGTNPPVYRSRYEKGFVRYTWLDEGDGSQGHWKAEWPDGSVGFYGADRNGVAVPEARVGQGEGVFKYMLVDKVDVYGHRMTTTYQKFGDYSLPIRIGYVFVDGEPTYEVRMDYEERRDRTRVEYLSDGAPGFELVLTQRLRQLSVLSRGVTIRRYALTYSPYNVAGGVTRLARVETFGVADGLYPIVFDFDYSQSLGVDCDGQNCTRPFVVDMGSVATNFSPRTSTLLDINGDGLPDLLDTSRQGQPHRFFINVAEADGTSRFDPQARESAIGTQSTHDLQAATVQVLDVDGDGFTDLINATNGNVLFNKGGGDWDSAASGQGTSNLAQALAEDIDVQDGQLGNLRFIDFNNDKKIDVMRATNVSTSFFENRGEAGFGELPGVDPIGVGFEQNLQLSDMNGDGLLDVVQVQIGGLRYRLNLGWGKWGEWVAISGLPIEEAQIPAVELEDINGDGLADLVVVQSRSVTYALNNNSTDFDGAREILTGDVEGEMPLRDPSVTVLFADMNANGSSDVVWVTSLGQIHFLELFPLRPNLMTRITNAIGAVTDIEYETAAQQMARDGGAGAWRYRIPYPMNLVRRLDTFDLLTDLHEVTEYTYHDGFYDGQEKQFRGFERVEIRTIGDESHEENRLVQQYDVGAVDPYFNGLLLREEIFSAGRALREVDVVFEDCPVDQIPNGTEFDVRHICQTAVSTLLKEGRGESEWIEMTSANVYDGYGNVTQMTESGVVSVGGQGCAPCERGADVYGEPCGAQCLGDERVSRTDYVTPDNTNGRWILRAPFREVTSGRDGDALATEVLTYYDGDDFAGLPLGQLDQAKVTRKTEKVSVDSTEVIETVRNRFDGHGNVVETLDPNGDPNEHRNRRRYTYDRENLRVALAEILLEDEGGAPYTLQREMVYEQLFDKVAEATAWMRAVDGRVVSSRRSYSFSYDEFGRRTEQFYPGNLTDSPDEEVTYDLQSPASRIIIESRSEQGGALDLEKILCIDGRGRRYQARTLIEAGRYQVSGLTRYNVRSQPVEVFQPYTSASASCDLTPAPGTLSRRHTYDGTGRKLTEVHPDGAIYGSESTSRTVYGPLEVLTFDSEDNDGDSPHTNTPDALRHNGLGRVVSMGRRLTAGGPLEAVDVHYDGLGRLSVASDPGGNDKTQSYDLLGRITRIDDPNAGGETLFEYDAVGNPVRVTDGRGVAMVSVFDGMNRVVERFDDGDPQGTRIAWRYDHDPDCAECTNGEGRTISIAYPGRDGERNIDRYGYDIRTRLVRYARQLDGHNFEMAMAFDNVNRLLATTYPNGRTIENRYDRASRLAAIDGVIPTIDYDDRGLFAGMGCADGSETAFAFDDLMRLARQETTGSGGGVLQGFEYQRDRMGNVRSITDLGMDAPSRPGFDARFTYDAWYRLVEAQLDPDGVSAETLTYGFDGLDNLLSVRSSNAQSAANRGDFGYDSFAPNAVTQVGGVSLDYDLAGHAIERGDKAMVWDFMGRLTQVDAGGATLARMTYGSDQSRVSKSEGDSRTLYITDGFEVRDGIATIYVKIGHDRVARFEDAALTTELFTDLDANGEINAGDAFLAAGNGDATPAGQLLRASIGRLLVATGPDDGATFLHRDHIGSITMATGSIDGSTVVQGERSFTPLGLERADDGGYVDEYGFTGQEIDRATGFVHFDWRYYDPRAGRWLSIDPLFKSTSVKGLGSFGEATTGYAYVAGNFTNMRDPTGLAGGRFQAFRQNRAAKKALSKAKSRGKNQLKSLSRVAIGGNVGTLIMAQTAKLQRATDKSGRPTGKEAKIAQAQIRFLRLASEALEHGRTELRNAQTPEQADAAVRRTLRDVADARNARDLAVEATEQNVSVSRFARSNSAIELQQIVQAQAVEAARPNVFIRVRQNSVSMSEGTISDILNL